MLKRPEPIKYHIEFQYEIVDSFYAHWISLA